MLPLFVGRAFAAAAISGIEGRPAATRPVARNERREVVIGRNRASGWAPGDGATHRRAMHQAGLGQIVVLDNAMLVRAVVPHQHIARLFIRKRFELFCGE
jgi:hypothetical protein